MTPPLVPRFPLPRTYTGVNVAVLSWACLPQMIHHQCGNPSKCMRVSKFNPSNLRYTVSTVHIISSFVYPPLLVNIFLILTDLD